MKKLIVCLLCVLPILFTSCIAAGEFSLDEFEQILSAPFTMTGTLTKDNVKYDVSIRSNCPEDLFKIEFLSGEATKGLTIEFFENGTFLYFDDLRFKTNNEFFTSLDRLKAVLASMAAADVAKTCEKSDINESLVLYEVSLPAESGGNAATMYVNASSMKPVRLVIMQPNSNLTLDVTGFEEFISATEQYSTLPDVTLPTATQATTERPDVMTVETTPT